MRSSTHTPGCILRSSSESICAAECDTVNKLTVAKLTMESCPDVLDPLQNAILNEQLRKKCANDLVPKFWNHFHDGPSTGHVALLQFSEAVGELRATIQSPSFKEALLSMQPLAGSPLLLSSTMSHLLQVLRTSLSISQPAFIYSTVKSVFAHLMEVWSERLREREDMDNTEDMETDGGGAEYWEQFTQLVTQLRDLHLLELFADHAVAEVVHAKVQSTVREQCSQEFDSSLLLEAVTSVQTTVVCWITHIYGDTREVREQWLPQVEYFGYHTFAELRVSELFDILVEYPDSEPALHDLRACLEKVDLRTYLISSLKTTFEQRLLHPGANTADIITQYISSVKGLRLLDPSGVVLEQVCEGVRSYLRTREDTVRCIVASLTDDSSNELADELVTGEPVLVDLNEESDGEDQDFYSWQPDPVDADPTKTSKSRQTSDIISLLVNIYGSREMFVNEYRNLLADRLLQSLNYDTSREVRNLELLKLRFGESNLHFCEVMIKDMADSKRINGHILSQLNKKKTGDGDTSSTTKTEVELNTFILSHVFWPNFREEKLKLPDFIQSKLDEYCEGYKSHKGMRTLEWKPHLGLVQVELQLSDRELSLNVSPIRAVIIHHFQDKCSWTVDGLSTALEAQPSVTRRHLGFWVGQGVLKEHPTDTFTVVEQLQEGVKNITQAEGEDEDESVMASLEEQKESELQVFWSYIVGMLTNLGKMPLDKVHSMLRMFAIQGAGGKDCTQAELKAFLDRKVREQHLSFAGGQYQLSKQ